MVDRRIGTSPAHARTAHPPLPARPLVHAQLKSTALFVLALASVSALKRTIVNTPGAPGAIGPYSQAVVLQWNSGETKIQAAGQIGLDPTTGELVPGGISNQTARAMDNIKAIMEAGGAKMADIVECTVLMQDLKDYAALNAVYATYFDAANAPARAAFQVVALPEAALTEIKCSAALTTES